MNPSNQDLVLIAGAGPTGLSLAVELARRRLPCRIIDRASARIVTSNALAIQARTLEVFESMGIVDQALAAGYRLRGLNIYGERRNLAHIEWDTLDTPYPFILSLPQSETERIMAEELERLGVTVERQVELTGIEQDEAGVSARLSHAGKTEETCRAAWLIGCDGAHSATRHALAVPFDGGDYQESFMFADLGVTGPLSKDAVHLFFHPEGLLIFIPINEKLWRIIANLPGTGDDSLPTLEEMQALVDQRGPGGVSLSNVHWSARPHIHHRKVSRFRQGRVFLAGDAAHIHSPAGGQGMNTGIQDAFNLGWKLGLVMQGYADESLLDSYDAERGPVVRNLLAFTDRVTRIATFHDPVAQVIRDHLISLFAGHGVRVFAERLASRNAELAVDYTGSPIVAEDEYSFPPRILRAGPKAGERAPDGELQSPAAEKTQLFRLFRDPGHCLLLFAGPDSSTSARALAQIASAVRDEYADLISSYMIVTGKSAPAGFARTESLLFDREGLVHRRYGADVACLYLVRPDGYIGFRASPPRLERLEEYLTRIFGFAEWRRLRSA